MPEQLAASRLSHSAEGLHFTGDYLTYRITGLTSYNLERLRVTLKAYQAEKQSLFHVDTIDLYNSRAREAFADACAKYLTIEPQHVTAELSSLIVELETERISMRDKGSASTVIEMTDAERTEALKTLRDKELLKRIIDDFDSLGFVGENNNKLLGYITAVSRFLTDPLAMLVLSRPGAGKTALQNAVCKFVPPEHCIQYTRLTGQSLFYHAQDQLKNKVLAIEEEEGMQDAMYSVKTLISQQHLTVSTTRTDPATGKMSSDAYKVEGPVVVFVSTTRPDCFNDEVKRRFLILTIDETPEQTKNILNAQRVRNSPRWYQLTSDEATVTRLHHNMQRLLKPITVMIPDELKISFPPGRLQIRAEQAKFLSLVKAITFLHQYQRKTGTVERLDGTKLPCVYATQADVDTAFEIAKPVFIRNVDDVSPTGRVLLAEIERLVSSKYEDIKKLDPKRDIYFYDIPFSRKELRDFIGWSETQVRVNIEPLVELGYLGKLQGRQGSACRYVMIDNGKDDPTLEFQR